MTEQRKTLNADVLSRAELTTTCRLESLLEQTFFEAEVHFESF